MNKVVLKGNDYYPFGMLVPQRNYSSPSYRYGFQSQEKDDEIKGNGNSVNYKYRMHDPRLGRFFAVDPLSSDYPHNSPYAFSENVVINAVELEGLEKEFYYDAIKNAEAKAKLNNNPRREYRPKRNESGMPVIDNTHDAIVHYYRGNGETIELGDNTKKGIKNTSDLNYYRDRIEKGKTSNPAEGSGLKVDATSSTYHLGKMVMSYSTICEGGKCTTTYTVDDKGFVDANEVMGNWFGEGDNEGPNAELGGVPYDYNPVIWSETYDNPGYDVDENGVPSQPTEGEKKQ